MKKALLSVCSVLLTAVLLASCFAGAGGVAIKTPYSDYTQEEVLQRVSQYCDYYGLTEQAAKEHLRIWNQKIDDTVQEYVYADIAWGKAEEMGLLPLSAEEGAQAEALHTSMLSEVEEVAQKNGGAANDYLAALGFTPEEYKAYAQKLVAAEKLADLLAEGDSVSDAELKAAYEAKIEEQKKLFAMYPDFVADYIGDPEIEIYYIPENVRRVKVLTVPFPSAERGQAAILQKENKVGEYREFVAEAAGRIQPETDAVRAKLDAGDTLDEAGKEYGGAGSVVMYGKDPNIAQAYIGVLKQMARPGDLRECDTSFGHNFVECEEVFAEGPVPFGDVEEALRQTLLEEKKQQTFDARMRQWMEEGMAKGEIKIRKEAMYDGQE